MEMDFCSAPVNEDDDLTQSQRYRQDYQEEEYDLYDDDAIQNPQEDLDDYEEVSEADVVGE